MNQSLAVSLVSAVISFDRSITMFLKIPLLSYSVAVDQKAPAD